MTTDAKPQRTSMDRLWRTLRILGWIGVAAILLAPAVAMRFTTEVNWEVSDFLFAGTLLIGGAGLIELFAWKVRTPLIRIVFALGVVALVAVIWGSAIN